jgi:hypothetical protein
MRRRGLIRLLEHDENITLNLDLVYSVAVNAYAQFWKVIWGGIGGLMGVYA